jgi:hypothetical protein
VQINRGVFLTLNGPELPKGAISQEEMAAYTERMSEVVAQAKQGFSGIEGLKVNNLMKTGYAIIDGSAEAVVKALELDCVKNGAIGDRPSLRGSVVG